MPDRRAVSAGLLLAALPLGGARAQPAPVPFKLRIYIPSTAVSYLGDNFGGGEKIGVEGAIDLSRSGPSALSISRRFVGKTREYADAYVSAVAGKPSWYTSLAAGAPILREGGAPDSDDTLSAAWTAPAGATHGVRIKVEAANPLVAGAPAIDAVFDIGLRRNGAAVQCRVSGQHDGFPNYELRVGGRLLVNYDAVAAGDTPTALFPPAERSVAVGWTAL